MEPESDIRFVEIGGRRYPCKLGVVEKLNVEINNDPSIPVWNVGLVLDKNDGTQRYLSLRVSTEDSQAQAKVQAAIDGILRLCGVRTQEALPGVEVLAMFAPTDANCLDYIFGIATLDAMFIEFGHYGSQIA